MLLVYFWSSVIVLMTIAYAIGLLLSSKYYISTVTVFEVPPNSIWNRITQFTNYPVWRLNLKNVKILSSHEWTETDNNNDQISFVMTILEDKKKVKIEVTNRNLTYEKFWIVTVNTVGHIVLLRIEEEGEEHNPFFRTLVRYIIGQKSYIRQYISFLKLSYYKKEPQVSLVRKSTQHHLTVEEVIRNTNSSGMNPYFSVE